MTVVTRWTILLSLLGVLGAVGAPRASLAVPSSEPSPLTIPTDRAGLKGMTGHWWHMTRYGDRLLDEYDRLGVINVRLAIDWILIEPSEGRRDWTRLDPIMAGFRDRSIEVLPVISSIVPWATTNPDECSRSALSCLPDRNKTAAFQDTIRQLAVRYPELRRWEFWNEPEMWDGVRNAPDYEWWYRALYQAVKDVSPSARIAVGTLGGWDFFSRLSPDLPADAVSIHSYAGHLGDPLQTDRIYRLRDGLRSTGRAIPIWLTEYGWDSRWMPNADRAKALEWVFRWLLDNPYIEVADYQMLYDAEDDGCCFGIVGGPPSFTPKQPAYDLFRSYLVAG